MVICLKNPMKVKAREGILIIYDGIWFCRKEHSLTQVTGTLKFVWFVFVKIRNGLNDIFSLYLQKGSVIHMRKSCQN